MKTFKLIIAVAALLVAGITSQAQTQPVYGFVAQPVVSTATGTKGVSGVAWTNAIAAATTNLTLVSSPGSKDLALQFSASLMATNASSVTVIWQLARSVSGGSSTNLNGSPMVLDLFATVTNTVAVNGTTSPPQIVNYGAGTTPAKGAIPFVYVYSCTPSGGTVTNASVYATGL